LRKTGVGVTALVVIGGLASSFALLGLLSLAGPFIVPATIVVYGLVYGLILPIVLFVLAVGMPSWSGMKTRWRNMHRWQYRW